MYAKRRWPLTVKSEVKVVCTCLKLLFELKKKSNLEYLRAKLSYLA